MLVSLFGALSAEPVTAPAAPKADTPAIVRSVELHWEFDDGYAGVVANHGEDQILIVGNTVYFSRKSGENLKAVLFSDLPSAYQRDVARAISDVARNGGRRVATGREPEFAGVASGSGSRTDTRSSTGAYSPVTTNESTGNIGCTITSSVMGNTGTDQTLKALYEGRALVMPTTTAQIDTYVPERNVGTNSQVTEDALADARKEIAVLKSAQQLRDALEVQRAQLKAEFEAKLQQQAQPAAPTPEPTPETKATAHDEPEKSGGGAVPLEETAAPAQPEKVVTEDASKKGKFHFRLPWGRE
ncbi:hypothetical protein COU76_00380 [Candidatus Peregrinibacteria bacterium CG10_big_fil_rev_8_21_14_0_10_49_10]|nr:MAG: hypothetical protein COU76_00380 [Candidatus Peregrinibacteria bacterium CG10_big_fil_rev_8_21_14_0_10_49_10]